MVEPLFRKKFSSAPVVGDLVVLDAEEAKHAITVRRMRVGEQIQLTDGLGLRVKGTVGEVLTKTMVISVDDVVQEGQPQPEITLIQALAKGDRDELAIQAATELGIMHVVPWQADRSISRWDDAKALKGRVRWQVICDEAAKQSLRVWHPRVQVALDSEALAATLQNYDAVFVLDPTAPVGLATRERFAGKIALIVGPEGGIDEAELAKFEKTGAVRVRLGDSILRTSTAGVVAISVIHAALGSFG